MTSLPSFFVGVIINHEKGIPRKPTRIQWKVGVFVFPWLTYQIGGFTNFSWNTVGRNPAPVKVGRLSHYLQGFIHPRWCRISFLQQYDGISSSHHMKIHHSMPWNRKHVRSIAPLLFHYWGQRLLRYIYIYLYSYTVDTRRTNSEIPINQPTLHGTSHVLRCHCKFRLDRPFQKPMQGRWGPSFNPSLGNLQIGELHLHDSLIY